MGLLDVIKGLFGLSSDIKDVKNAVTRATTNTSVNAGIVEDDDDDDDEGLDDIEKEWKGIQKEIARVEAENVDLCGIVWSDPVSYWTMNQKIQAGQVEGKSVDQAAKEAGFKNGEHWEEVSNYVYCKWSKITTNEEGEQEIGTPEEFVNGALKANSIQSAGMMAQAAAADPTLLEPVNGVTLEQWANSAAAMAALGTTGTQEQVTQILAKNGLDQATYDVAQAGWTKKMQEDTSFVITTKYGEAFSAAQGMTADSPEPCSFEKYHEILAAQECWSKQGLDIATQFQSVFGITVAEFSKYGSYWSPKMASDLSMADKSTKLHAKYVEKYSAAGMDDDLSL